MSSDLRIQLSRMPTSASGGGVVFLVRVTDLSGQPLSDAEVSMLAGGGPAARCSRRGSIARRIRARSAAA
jgi:hypothetical protein